MIKNTSILYRMKDERDALMKAYMVLSKLDELIGTKNLVSLTTGEIVTVNDIIDTCSLIELLLEDAFEIF